MAIKDDALFENEKNCKVSDLVGGYPPSTEFDQGTRMYAYNDETKQLEMVFKLVDVGDGLVWMRLGEI